MEELELEIILNASTEEIYNDWLSDDGHSEMTGGEATGSKELGFEYSAWDGYISGKNLELVENQKIVQTWRTVEFPEDAPNSHLEISLEALSDHQTKLILKQKDLQIGDAKKYSDGWKMHYFEPMTDYYSK